MELVNLFKELMKRGWKVYGEYDKLMSYGQTRGKKDFGFGVLGEIKYSLRELVSKESGLWQFVCDKGLVEMYEGFYWQNIFPLDSKEYDYTDYQYWILESSLIDESELEKFLLENIKIS